MGPQTWGLAPQRRQRVGAAVLVTFLAVTLAAGWLTDAGSGPGSRWLQRGALGLSAAGLALMIGTYQRRAAGTAAVPAPVLTPDERRTAKECIRGGKPLEGIELSQLRAFADRTGRQTARDGLLLCGTCMNLIGTLLQHQTRVSLWGSAAVVVAVCCLLIRSQREIARCRAFLDATAARPDPSQREPGA